MLTKIWRHHLFKFWGPALDFLRGEVRVCSHDELFFLALGAIVPGQELPLCDWLFRNSVFDFALQKTEAPSFLQAAIMPPGTLL